MSRLRVTRFSIFINFFSVFRIGELTIIKIRSMKTLKRALKKEKTLEKTCSCLDFDFFNYFFKKCRVCCIIKN